jgi:hypothetical protein
VEPFFPSKRFKRGEKPRNEKFTEAGTRVLCPLEIGSEKILLVVREY